MAVAKQFATIFYSWTLYQMIFQSGESDEGLGTDLYTRPTGEFTEQAIKDFARSTYAKYVEMVRRSIGPDTNIVILRIPFGYEIHLDDARRYGSSGIRLNKPASMQKTAEVVKDLAPEFSMTFVDPTPNLRQNSAAARQYNFIDVHFTPAGNKTVADHAAPKLVENVSHYKQGHLGKGLRN